MSTCPPCNQKCNQGRDCPANKQGQVGMTFDASRPVTITSHPYFFKRPWVGLTEPELHEIKPTWPAPGQHWDYEDVLAFARAVESKLKEKNGG